MTCFPQAISLNGAKSKRRPKNDLSQRLKRRHRAPKSRPRLAVDVEEVDLKAAVAAEVVAQNAVEEHLAVAEVLLQPTVCVVLALERRTRSLLQVRLNWIHRFQMV